MRLPFTTPSAFLFAGVSGFALARCGDDPTRAPDASVDAPLEVRGCAPPAGAGVVHGAHLATPETWTAAASPHVVMFDTTVSSTITLEACAVVRIAGGRTVTVGAGGALIAAGAPGRPVTIERRDASAPWAVIRALGGDLSLTHAIVRGGGDPRGVPTLGAAILMQRSAGITTGSLHVDDVEIADSASQGVYLPSFVGFDATSQNLRVHGAAGYPIFTYARVLGSIPAGAYTGNGRDEILISTAGGGVVDDQTMHDRGVPYHIGIGAESGRFNVAAPTGVATLTIEPGVTLRFKSGGQLMVDTTDGAAPAHGALVAVGTAARPIVFTSDAATPRAGDWLGIWFGGATSAATTMQHARIEYAGGAVITGSNSCPYAERRGEANYAAIRVVGPPTRAFVTNSQIVASARDGIDRGWRNDVQPDFLPTNTFTDVAGCRQTTPRTAAGVCPPAPVCQRAP